MKGAAGVKGKQARLLTLNTSGKYICSPFFFQLWLLIRNNQHVLKVRITTRFAVHLRKIYSHLRQQLKL